MKTTSRLTPHRLLKVVVLSVERTPNKAYIYTIGLADEKSVTPIGKTNAQRRIIAEQGELMGISIDGISKSGNKYGLINPTPVKFPGAIAAPNSMADLARFFEAGK